MTDGASPLHRLPAGVKLAALGAAGTVAFLVADPLALALGLAVAAGLAALARLPPREIVGVWRPSAVVLALVLLAQGLGGDWAGGVAAVLRLAALILLAAVVTATTRPSDMAEAIATALRPLRPLGLDSDRVALGLSLALRFLPLLAAEAALVREAQRARGLDRSPLALFVPLLVRMLKMADDLAEAIEARGGG